MPLLSRVARLLGMAGLIAASAASAQPISTLTMMSYNLHGLPWPVVSDRSAELRAIADRLRALRMQGRAPQIVAVQEAFVPEAKAIGRLAGYRYIAFGPAADDPAAPATDADRAFLADGSYWRGEGVGKRVDSGLAIFSDYPIIATRRIAFPVCAGYDCLANKGVLAAMIAVPGLAAPVTVVDTHLNSAHASRVPTERALYAYRRQIDAVVDFLRAPLAAGAPLLVAGDFNVGNGPQRSPYMRARLGQGAEALGMAQRVCAEGGCLMNDAADVGYSIHRARDWFLYRGGSGIGFTPVALSAPFGHDARGAMLSDHVGITVTYRVDARPPRTPLVRLASR